MKHVNNFFYFFVIFLVLSILLIISLIILKFLLVSIASVGTYQKKDWLLAKFSYYGRKNVNIKYQHKSSIRDFPIHDNKKVAKEMEYLNLEEKTTGKSMKVLISFRKKSWE